MTSTLRTSNLGVEVVDVTTHPQIHVLARLTATALAWASFVVANPAGAAEPMPAPTVRMSTIGVRERVGITARAAAQDERVERARERTRRVAIERARRLSIARARRLAAARARRKARLARQAVLAEKARRFRATHRCPVDGPNRRWLAGDWHPQPYQRAVDGVGAEKRGHEGIDLFAREGTPVRAPFDGWVRFGTSPRGGKWFKLVGGGGYVYGAHMTAFGPRGGRVRTADIIGYVGRTGNAGSTHPHLHLQWHPGGGRAANPAPLLRARCGPPATSYPT